MRAYRAVFKLRMLLGLQYRVAALAGVATQFFWGMMMIMIYEAFYSHTTGTPPISLNDLITYLWLQQSFLAFIMLWYRDMEIFNLITSGNIAYELCRPCGLYGFWYAKLIAQRLSGALLRCSPILVVAFLLPEPYGLDLPPSWASALLFLVTLSLGLMVLTAISMFIYISVFYTMSPVGSTLLIGVLGEFCAGLVIPVPLMPGWLQQIVSALPFRYASDLPFRVYSGHIPVPEALWGVLIQLAWLALLVGTGSIWLRRSLRRVVIQGG
ncbi:ABC transporter permease [Gorillibacterium sp. sgz5001074]|uniref:ABC transporter permease n=1 Tax=Gorillibacterium sp. sgz5001074 TaxID=3446695 RepID=UPI003F676839